MGHERGETCGNGGCSAAGAADLEVPATQLDHALRLAALGFWVFPLIEMGKTPAIDGWQKAATRDATEIRRMWTCPVTGWTHAYNVGIFTSRYANDKALLVVDVDVKGDKRGDLSVIELEIEGFDFGDPVVALTPTGGQHLLYVVDEPVSNRADVRHGLDIRSRGGYVVGAGSVVEAGTYRWR